jgi:hypothetical protein
MRSIIIVLLTAVGLALTGCASEQGGTPVPTELSAPMTATTVTAAPAAVPLPSLAESSRDAYLNVVGDEIPAASDGQLLDYADLACKGIAADGEPLYVSIILAEMRPVLTDEQAGAVVGGVLGALYCDHAWPGAR